MMKTEPPQASPGGGKAAARITVGNLLAVMVGGFLGAALRVGLGFAFPEGGGFPTTTLVVNLSGTAALAALTSYWQVTHRGRPWLRAGIGTGFLGAYTTFSSLVLFVLDSPLPLALSALLVSLSGCAAVAWLVMAGVERMVRPTVEAQPDPGAAAPGMRSENGGEGS
ncbi:MAG: CrcB family protein [Paeniglutamicibacter terrestris]